MLIFQILAMIVNHLNYAAKYEGTYEGTDEADPQTPASPSGRTARNARKEVSPCSSSRSSP